MRKAKDGKQEASRVARKVVSKVLAVITLVVLVSLIVGGLVVNVTLYRDQGPRRTDAEQDRRLAAVLFTRQQDE